MSQPFDFEYTGDFSREDLLKVLEEIHRNKTGDGCTLDQLLELRSEYLKIFNEKLMFSQWGQNSRCKFADFFVTKERFTEQFQNGHSFHIGPKLKLVLMTMSGDLFTIIQANGAVPLKM